MQDELLKMLSDQTVGEIDRLREENADLRAELQRVTAESRAVWNAVGLVREAFGFASGIVEASLRSECQVSEDECETVQGYAVDIRKAFSGVVPLVAAK